MTRHLRFAVGAVASLAATAASADEFAIKLKPGAGADVAAAQCAACHSLDYPVTNSPFLDRQGWEGEVNKMIKVFGAPISPEDARIIVDYLAKTYGK